MIDFQGNLQQVGARMAAACSRVGRDPAAVELVAVSKGHPPTAVDAMVGAGHGLFGENKVQEARAKIPAVTGQARWHMIGHLQSNKCRDAVQLFEVIQSVDSLRLARELDRWAERLGRHPGVMLEVNVAGEANKFGYSPTALLKELPELASLPRLELLGLMAMAPWTSDPEKVRPVFRRLAELKTECDACLGAPMRHLSMGMSGDFEVGIEEGATIVRVGTALFGERPRPNLRSGLPEGP
jgi:pyridoxal phosphate enzyme (YggS family)